VHGSRQVLECRVPLLEHGVGAATVHPRLPVIGLNLQQLGEVIDGRLPVPEHRPLIYLSYSNLFSPFTTLHSAKSLMVKCQFLWVRTRKSTPSGRSRKVFCSSCGNMSVSARLENTCKGEPSVKTWSSYRWTLKSMTMGQPPISIHLMLHIIPLVSE
jgi:hypothetical protein